jgi:hypothetical protein
MIKDSPIIGSGSVTFKYDRRVLPKGGFFHTKTNAANYKDLALRYERVWCTTAHKLF